MQVVLAVSPSSAGVYTLPQRVLKSPFPQKRSTAGHIDVRRADMQQVCDATHRVPERVSDVPMQLEIVARVPAAITFAPTPLPISRGAESSLACLSRGAFLRHSVLLI
jgi:hypothetical protein